MPSERGATTEFECRAAELRAACKTQWVAASHNGDGPPSARRNYAELLEDLASSEQRVKQAYVSRYPIELLQNAHDAAARLGVRGKVWFEVTDTALLVANEGVGFNDKRLESLMRLGASDKNAGHEDDESIGYKGIGFTSVFEITDRPQFFTDCGFRFELNGQRAKREVEGLLGQELRDVPHRRFLFELTEDEPNPDDALIDTYLAEGAATVVRLPLKKGVSAESVLDHLEAVLAPELFVFMPSVNQIEVRAGSTARIRNGSISRRGNSETVSVRLESGELHRWAVRRKRFSVPKRLIQSLDDLTWKRVKRLDTAVALPLRGRKPDPEGEPGSVHVYFPTDESHGRRLLIHGDFYVDQSRRRVDMNEGPARELNELVMSHVAELAADLAEAYAQDGSAMLSCFASREHESAFGAAIGELIEDRLSKRKILRTGDEAEVLFRPDKLERIGHATLPVRRDLLSISRHPGAYLDPRDELDELSEFFENLGCTVVDAVDFVKGLDARGTAREFESVLRAIQRWLDEVGYERSEAIEALRNRHVLQDEQGKWRKPRDLALGTSGVALPRKLAKSDAAMPNSSALRTFIVDELEVEEVDPSRAVELVLEALAENTIGGSEPQRRDVLRFFEAMWVRHSDVLGEFKGGLGSVAVPAATHAGTNSGWQAAELTYFTDRWEGANWPSQMFAGFGESEFLSEKPPRGKKAQAARRAFFELLGVSRTVREPAVEMRTYDLSSIADLFKDGAIAEWIASDEVNEAWRCSVHLATEKLVRFATVDRIDRLIADVDAKLLAEFLGNLDSPLGAEATIRCVSPKHRGPAPTHRCPGPQHSMLLESAWVPVREGGAEAFCRPGLAWYDIPRSSVLPKTQIRKASANKLKFLVDGRNPKPAAIADALERLREAHPQLADASPEVRETASWLMRRLDRALRTPGPKAEIGLPPLPASRDGVSVWSDSPLILDSPSLGRIPGVEFTEPEIWRGLDRRLGLKRATTHFRSAPQPGSPRRADGFLSARSKAELAAYLFARGAPPGIASRLDNLEIKPVSQLDVEYSDPSGRKTLVPGVPFHLRSEQTGGRGRWRGELTIAMPIDERIYIDLSHELDRYLNTPQNSNPDAIVLYLSNKKLALSSAAVSEDDVDEMAKRMKEEEVEYVPSTSVVITAPEMSGAEELERDQEPLDNDVAVAFGATQSFAADTDGGGVAHSEPQPTRAGYTVAPGAAREAVALPDLNDVSLKVVVSKSFAESSGDAAVTANGNSDGLHGGAWSEGPIGLSDSDSAEIGRRGEELVFECEQKRVRALGLEESLVDWVADKQALSNYDIKSVDDFGNTTYIEVKSTTASDPAQSFVISGSEMRWAETHPDAYYVCRVVDVATTEPTLYVYPLLDEMRKGGFTTESPLKFSISLASTVATAVQAI